MTGIHILDSKYTELGLITQTCRMSNFDCRLIVEELNERLSQSGKDLACVLSFHGHRPKRIGIGRQMGWRGAAGGARWSKAARNSH